VSLVASLADLQRAVGEVARHGAGYSTSLFASGDRLGAWIEAGTVHALRSEGALLVLHRDGDLLRVHHVASSPAALSEALALLPGAWSGVPFVSELVGRSPDLHDVLETYRERGFRDHARLERMQYDGPFPRTVAADPGVEVATESDAGPIHSYMERWLDPLSERIQAREALEASAAAGEILVVRDGGALAGFLIFEATGMSSIVRYWHVQPGRRSQGVGGRLMGTFLSRCAGSRRIVLWVLADNVDAIARYRHYGYRADGVVDWILTRRE